MAAAVTLLAMRTEVRRRANQETSNQAQAFVTDAEIDQLLNDHLRALYDVIVENHDDEYFRNTATLTTIANVDTYGLQSDFYKIVSVDVVWNPGNVGSAKRFNEADRNRFLNAMSSSSSSGMAWTYQGAVYYRTAGDNLVIQPTPSVSGVPILVNYVPSFVPLVADSDVFMSPNGWHRYAIWGAVADVLHKEESDTSMAMRRQEEVKASVVTLAGTRNVGEAPRVTRSRRGRDES